MALALRTVFAVRAASGANGEESNSRPSAKKVTGFTCTLSRTEKKIFGELAKEQCKQKLLLTAKTLGSRVRGNDGNKRFPLADKLQKKPAHQAPAKYLAMHRSIPITTPESNALSMHSIPAC
jgi:hypothetical protein